MGSLIACHECDLIHNIKPLPDKGAAHCIRCGAVLYKHKSNGRLLSRENRRHGKKMSFYFLFMPRIAVGSNAFDRRSVSGACQVR